jgi:hypothetical protein
MTPDLNIWTALLAFAGAAGLLTIVPGLDTLLVLRTATVEGPRRAMFAALGICTGCLAWGILVSAGLGAVFAVSNLAYQIVRISGAIYLVYLGIRLLVQREKASVLDSARGNTIRARQLALVYARITHQSIEPESWRVLRHLPPPIHSQSCECNWVQRFACTDPRRRRCPLVCSVNLFNPTPGSLAASSQDLNGAQSDHRRRLYSLWRSPGFGTKILNRRSAYGLRPFEVPLHRSLDYFFRSPIDIS